MTHVLAQFDQHGIHAHLASIRITDTAVQPCIIQLNIGLPNLLWQLVNALVALAKSSLTA